MWKESRALARHAWALWHAYRPAFLRDQAVVRVLLLALGLNMVVWAWLATTYSSLPPFVPLHFDAAGNPDRIAPRQDIFTLPVIGLVILVLNTSVGGVLYRRLPFASHMLFGGSVVMQGLLVVTVWQLVGQVG
ncbi:MAG: DUF1648 domain-containing protein [Ardenticatenia bacterium]|nr:DUF1648 domain-containing protein [Ardenticatenia bacterium]